jgi:hypothetical protein
MGRKSQVRFGRRALEKGQFHKVPRQRPTSLRGIQVMGTGRLPQLGGVRRQGNHAAGLVSRHPYRTAANRRVRA